MQPHVEELAPTARPSTPPRAARSPAQLIAWGILVILAVGVASYAGYAYAWNDPRSLGMDHLTALQINPVMLRIHAGCGALALLVALPQVLPVRRRVPLRWHRAIGWIYSLSVMTSGLAGLWLARTADGGAWGRMGFGMLAVLWLGTTVRGVRAAITGNSASHRRNMARSFALCCAAITLRMQLPLGALAGFSFEAYYPWVAWMCWLPNLIVVEWLLRRR